MDFSTPPIQQAPKTERSILDFGLLKVRNAKIQQAQTPILAADQFGGGKHFDKMSHTELIRIVEGQDLAQKRELSKWMFDKNGVYARSVRYLSDIYKFDFLIYCPSLAFEDEIQESKRKQIMKKYDAVLEHFDNSAIQLLCRRWTIAICSQGSYYGYICDDISDKIVIQDLPTDYCRSRFLYRGLPLVEFNVQYFEKVAKDENQREQLLRLFPAEIQKGYKQYKNNKLPAEQRSDKPGWILLDAQKAFKFSFNESDVPPFLFAVPSLFELDEVQDLEKEKLLQEIQKILIQKFQLDKNDQLPFTMPELQRLNQNALDMVGDAVGVSVLSTVADVHLEDLKTTAAADGIDRVKTAQNTVYNNFGISTNLFNTDGNLALDKSVIIDEAFTKPILLQFEQFFNRYLDWKFNKKDSKFRMKMLTTTIFNYKELSDKYKDLTKLGFSRFAPMVALGHTQREIISLAKLEQQVLQLDAYMLPPFSSNTMSSDTWLNIKQQQADIISGKNKTEQDVQTEDSEAKAGRPELPDDQKSDKTIANEQSK